MARKTMASVSRDRRKRLAAQQMDLFARRSGVGAPSWLDLPKDARQALVGRNRPIKTAVHRGQAACCFESLNDAQFHGRSSWSLVTR